MNKFLQIVCYAVSFLLVLAIGNCFEFFTDDYVHTLQDNLPGKPLPYTLDFFIKNHYTVSYFFLFPWLGFIGLPLLPLVRSSYWDTNLFLLRFSVFLPVELLILFFFSFIYFLPFIGMCTCMSDEGPPPLTWVEFSMRGFFWLSALLILIGSTERILRSRKSKR